MKESLQYPEEMKSLYEMIKTFTLNNFDDNYESEENGAEFLSFFDRSLIPEAADKVVDVENKARKAFEDAYIQGEKAGREMGMKKIEPIAKRLDSDIAILAAFKEDLVKKAEKLSVELALMFTEMIVLQECEEKRDIVIKMAKKALEICEEKSGISIRMRREDAQHISESSIHPMKIIPDDTLKDPGFVIETNFGDIDGTIATQIEELKKEFINGYTGK